MPILQYVSLFAALTAGVLGCSKPTLKSHGGYVITYRLAAGQDDINPQQMAAAMEQRLQDAGFDSASVAVLSEQEFTVELPGATEEQATLAQRRVETAGHLECHILAELGHDDELITEALAEVSSAAAKDRKFYWLVFNEEQVPIEDWMVLRDGVDDAQVLALVSDDDIQGSDFAAVTKGLDESLQPAIHGSLNDAGALKMSMLTGNNLRRRLGIVMDGRLLSAPVIQSPVGGYLQITGKFTEDEVETIVAALKSGSLPARLNSVPVSVRHVQPPRPLRNRPAE